MLHYVTWIVFTDMKLYIPFCKHATEPCVHKPRDEKFPGLILKFLKKFINSQQSC